MQAGLVWGMGIFGYSNYRSISHPCQGLYQEKINKTSKIDLERLLRY
jgi:hypothetical protein